MPRPLRVFLCHASQDKPAVRKLHRYLKQRGAEPWLDELDLLPGENWEVEIPRAIYTSDVILVCLSKNSINKEGYVQKEITFALDKALEKPEGTIFIIPAKLEECEVPKRLNRYHWVDLFRPDSNKRLLMGLNKRAMELGPDVTPVMMEDARHRTPIPKPARPEAQKEEPPIPDKEVVKDVPVKPEIKETPVVSVQPREEIKEEPKLPVGGSSREAYRDPNKVKPLPKKPFTRLLDPSSLSPKEQGKPRETPKQPVSRASSPTYLRALGISGLVIICLLFVAFGGNYLLNNLPATKTPTLTPSVTSKPSTSTATKIPFTSTPTFTPTPGIGSTMTSEKDGMVLVHVPAGEFTMGSNDGSDDEKPEHQVTLNAFWIDQTEVTNAMYAKCVSDGACDEPASTSSYTHSSYYGNSEFDDYPVLYVSWSMANTYCSWASRRLPTEAEWEKAARGTESFTYPWGNESPNSGLLNYSQNVGDTTEVGKYPSGASIYGALDMAGNVWEWVSSLYQPYPYDANDGRENMSSSGDRVLRGGSWGNYNNSSVLPAATGTFQRIRIATSVFVVPAHHSAGFLVSGILKN